jgi:hypothetical protein
MKSKVLTSDGLKGLKKPRPWMALSRVAVNSSSDISIKKPVVVSGVELRRLEAKIQALRDDLYAAHLKVRSLLKKAKAKRRRTRDTRKKQQARIVGRNKTASKSGSPFLTPNAWLELSKTERGVSG